MAGTTKQPTDVSNVAVAEVLDLQTVVLNQGKDSGVKVGFKYLIYTMGHEVFDPVSGESLGNLELIRGKVQVTHVQPKMATAKTYETRTVRVRRSDPSKLMGIFNDFYQTVDEPKQLDAPEVGDYARLLEG